MRILTEIAAFGLCVLTVVMCALMLAADLTMLGFAP